MGKLDLVMLLVLHIVFDLVLIQTDCGDKVASAPQGAFGKLVRLLLDPGRRFSFQNLEGIGNTVFGRNVENDMDVFISDMPLLYRESLPLCYLFEYPLQLLFNVDVCQDLATVLGSPDDMIRTDVRTMPKLI